MASLAEQDAPLVLPPRQDERTVAQHRRWYRAAPIVTAALLACAGALVFLRLRPLPMGALHGAPAARGARQVAAELRACVDTAGWADGATGCAEGEGGGDERLCRPGVGWTCLAYKRKGWCSDGLVNPDTSKWVPGAERHYPEENCCVCGGGRGLKTVGKLKTVMAELVEDVDEAVPVMYSMTSRFAGIAPLTKENPFGRFQAFHLVKSQVHTLQEMLWRQFRLLVRILPGLVNATSEIVGVDPAGAAGPGNAGLEWTLAELVGQLMGTNLTTQAVDAKGKLHRAPFSSNPALMTPALKELNTTVAALGAFLARVVPALIRGAERRTWALATDQDPALSDKYKAVVGAVDVPDRPACASNLVAALSSYVDTEGWLNYMAEDCAVSNWGQGAGSSMLTLECASDAAHSAKLLSRALSEVANTLLNCAYLDFSCESEILQAFEALSSIAVASLRAASACPDKNPHKCTRFSLDAATSLSSAVAHVHLALERCTSDFTTRQAPSAAVARDSIASRPQRRRPASRNLSAPFPVFNPSAPRWMEP